MKIELVFTFLFLSFLILLPIVYSHRDDTINAESQRSVSMSDKYCQVSCTDEEDGGTTYTVGLSGKVWLQETIPEQDYCAAQIYESVYKDDQLLSDPVAVLDIGFDDEQLMFGGYLFGEGSSVTTRGRGFMSAFTNLLQNQNYVLWKLLYSGYVALDKDTNTDTITATYTHRINPCPIGTYVSMHAMCDSWGGNFDEIALGCDIYQQGVWKEGTTNPDLYGPESTSINPYTHFIYCSASDKHSPPQYGCKGDEVYGENIYFK